MSDSPSILGKGGFNQTALTALRLGLVLIIVYWCYQILLPFIPLVVWGAIIAVAIYPLHQSLAARLGHRIKVSATLITLMGLIVLTAPVVVLTESLGGQSQKPGTGSLAAAETRAYAPKRSTVRERAHGAVRGDWHSVHRRDLGNRCL